MIEQIYEQFQNEAPNEACGLIVGLDDKEWYMPCRNVAESGTDFIIDPAQYMEALRKYDIKGIVHSHPNNDCTESAFDVQSCNATRIPYYIFAFPSMQLNIIYPNNGTVPLKGRHYRFGIFDCFSAAADYYKAVDIDVGPRHMWADDWWKKEENYMTLEEIHSRGFIASSNMKINDLLLFSVESDVPNHIGVYTGDGMFFHHAKNRLSCEDPLIPVWARFLVGHYKYAS